MVEMWLDRATAGSLLSSGPFPHAVSFQKAVWKAGAMCRGGGGR